MKKELLMLILALMFLVSGCTGTNTQTKEGIYGFYSWDSSVTELSIYHSEEESPLYYLSEDEFFPVFRRPSHYSPFSGGGIYYDSVIWSDAPNIQYETVKCDKTLFEEAGVDISGYETCEQFAATSHYTLYQMDDEIWVMERWRNDAIVIARLKKEDHYDFVPAVRGGENVRLLRDLSDPQIPDLTDPNMTKAELLDFIGQTDDSRIVAYLRNAYVDGWYPRYYDTSSPAAQREDVFWYDEYRVMEYCDGELRSWLSYVFWDTPEHYEEAKGNFEWNFLDLQNDALRMTCRIYAYDENLEPCYRSNFKVMDYDNMLVELQNNGYSLVKSDEKGIKVEPDTVEPIARYYGSIENEDFVLLIYDIKVFAGDINMVEFSIMDYNDDLIQHFWYELDSNFRPDTVDQGLQVADVNGDSNEDFILALGLLGTKNKPSACFVFDPAQKQFVSLDGFESLCLPVYLPLQQVFLTDNYSVREQFNYGQFTDEYMMDICYDKYRVVGSDLQLLARLIVYSKINGNGNEFLYTEERTVNGELEITADRVPKEMINWSDWEDEILTYHIIA